MKKDVDDLVMSRSEDFREQMEEYDIIQQATPSYMKHGDDYWSMSLRGEGEDEFEVVELLTGEKEGIQ